MWNRLRIAKIANIANIANIEMLGVGANLGGGLVSPR
jgi:hypothetical protein